MRVTQWAVQVASRKTKLPELAMGWSPDERAVKGYAISLYAGGRKDACVVTREIDVADPTPTPAPSPSCGSAAQHASPAAASDYAFGLAVGLSIGGLF